MRRICVFFMLIFGMTFTLFSQKSSIELANELYSKGDFTLAAEKYEHILKTEGYAPELYYNLGNSYYKLNEVGLSILNYERAIRLNPLFEDAKINLSFAQAKVIDNVIESPTFFVMKWLEGLIKLLDTNKWFYLSFFVFLLCLIFAFLFLFGNTTLFRKISFYVSVTLLSISVISLVFSSLRKNQIASHNQAIIMSGIVVAKSSPDKSGTDLFQLHEGTKVNLKSSLGNKWIEIELGNGEIGWVEKIHLEKI